MPGSSGTFVFYPLRVIVQSSFVRTSVQQPQRLYQLPPDKYQQAIHFNHRMEALHFAGVGWTLIVLALMIRFRVGRRLPGPVIAAVAAVLGIPWLASLPLAVYGHWLVLHYGLSIEPWVPWIWDWIKAGAVTGAVAVFIALAFLRLARWSPRRWWLYAWMVAVVFMVIATYAVPLVFDPLFHRFVPLASVRPGLIGPIEMVAARAGQRVPPERIYEMIASEKTRTLNAYMTGFGDSKRIVIWDTTADTLTSPEIQTVFAHELGHYVLRHIPRSLLIAAVGLLAGFYWLKRILDWVAARWGARLQIRSLAETSMLPVALLLITTGAFLMEPIANTYSRWQEHEADVYELTIMRQLIPHAGPNSARVDQIMAEIALDDPDPSPFVRFWLYDHPATEDRMRFAVQFAP
jgi:STE24 endopeptidase